jgi:hypothetical protein
MQQRGKGWRIRDVNSSASGRVPFPEPFHPTCRRWLIARNYRFFGITPSILWDNIQTNLPVLKKEILKIIRSEESGG